MGRLSKTTFCRTSVIITILRAMMISNMAIIELTASLLILKRTLAVQSLAKKLVNPFSLFSTGD